VGPWHFYSMYSNQDCYVKIAKLQFCPCNPFSFKIKCIYADGIEPYLPYIHLIFIRIILLHAYVFCRIIRV